MKKTLSLLLITLLLFSISEWTNAALERQVFGCSLRWEALNPYTLNGLTRIVDQVETEYTISHDPDCIWRPQKNNKCENQWPEQTKEVESLAEVVKAETLGYFDVKMVGKTGTSQRDFGGISQGFVLEKMYQKFKGPWLGDFSGDIFLTGGFTPSKSLTITDPLIDRGTYATVKMHSGWMLSSSSKLVGAKMRNPVDPNQKEEYLRIVVFAKKEFNGGRLDAWKTGIQVGGHKVLDYLWSLPTYRGQWAYMYFGVNGDVKCSPNLKCNLKNPDNRLVTTLW